MVLIVDDDPIIATLIKHAFGDIDSKVFSSFADLVNEPEENIKDAAIVVTDMGLGDGHDGVDVKDYMKSLNPNVKSILITGGTYAQNITGNFDAIVYKPFKLDNLRALLTNL